MFHYNPWGLDNRYTACGKFLVDTDGTCYPGTIWPYFGRGPVVACPDCIKSDNYKQDQILFELKYGGQILLWRNNYWCNRKKP